jgi:ABC-2 type transport system permease protein
MAVYKRGYQRYSGHLTGRWTRLLAYPRFAWKRLVGQRLVVIALILSAFPPLIAALLIYVANHQEVWTGLGIGSGARLLEINDSFFLVVMNFQATFAVVVAALTGPGLVAPDLANGGLSLYFSRPLTRTEYVAARIIVLAGLLSMLTWVPVSLLFAMQWNMAGNDWAWANWNIAAGVVGGSAVWILFVSLVALASSAWVKWRIIAGVLVLALFFVSAGAGQIANAVFRDTWGNYSNPGMNMSALWRAFFGMDPARGMEPETSAVVLAAMASLFTLALARKLRAVEVVR